MGWLRRCWLLAWLVAGSAMAQPLQLQDDAGRRWTFERPPQRWVLLLPSLTESAWAVGAGSKIVGVDRWSNWPPQLAALPRLGGLDDLQIESVLALKPDVVLASTSGRALDRLEQLGLKVLRLRSETVDDVQRTLQLMAQLHGEPGVAAPLWARVQQQLAAQAARVPARWRGARVYVEIGGGPYAAGEASFIGATLQRLGLQNIVPASLGPFPKLNPEFIVQAQPQLIIGSPVELAGLAQRPGWAAIPAVQRQALCRFAGADNDLLVRPGPRLAEAAAKLVDCLERLP